jgi:hypothetical protein
MCTHSHRHHDHHYHDHHHWSRPEDRHADVPGSEQHGSRDRRPDHPNDSGYPDRSARSRRSRRGWGGRARVEEGRGVDDPRSGEIWL